MIDEHGTAAGSVSAIHVTPAIPDEETTPQIDRMIRRGAKQHPRLRFPAIARLAVAATGVITDFDCVDGWHSVPQFPVHGFDEFAALRSATDIGLIRYHNEGETRLLQFGAALGNFGIQLKLFQSRRWKRNTIANDRPVQDAIAIEKNGGPGYFVLSHFVCAVFSAG